MTAIDVRGACEGILHGADLRVPLDALVCFSGPAGGGARTMAVEVLHAESRRRYMMALAPGERAELGTMARVAVEAISGLPPTVHVDARSTGGAVDLGQALRVDGLLCQLLHACGQVQCPACGAPCESFTVPQAVDRVLRQMDGRRCLFLAPLVPEGKDVVALLEEVRRAGFLRARVDGRVLRLDAPDLPPQLAAAALVELVVDRVRVAQGQRNRIREAIRSARAIAHGRCLVQALDGQAALWLNQYLTCSSCAQVFSRPTADELLGAGGDSTNVLVEHIRIGGCSLSQLRAMPLGDLQDHLAGAADSVVLHALSQQLDTAVRCGLRHRSLDQLLSRMSAGERVKAALARCLSSGLAGVLYIFEGLGALTHAQDVELLLHRLRDLVKRGNSVIVITGHDAIRAAATQVVEFSPGALTEPSSPTPSVPPPAAAGSCGRLQIRRTSPEDAGVWELELPLGSFVVFSGASGTGKTRFVQDVLLPGVRGESGTGHDFTFHGHRGFTHLVEVAQGEGRLRGALLLVLGLGEHLARIFAESPAAQRRGYPSEWFRLDVPGGRCAQCEGAGVLRYDMDFLEDIALTCPGCQGRRFRAEVNEVTVGGISISEALTLEVNSALQVFSRDQRLRSRLTAVQQCGLGDVKLGKDVRDLEPAQRVRLQLALELPRLGSRHLLFLDLPVAGEHDREAHLFVDAVHACISSGATVLVLENHPVVLAAAETLVEFSSEGLRVFLPE